MQIYAPLRTPSASHRCTPHARHSTTRPSPPHAHACEPERRRTHRSPSTPQPTPLPSRPNRTHSTFLPAALYKTPSILTHRSPRTQNPSSGAAPRVGAASPALPYGGGAQSNSNQDVSMPGTSDDRGSPGQSARECPPQPPTGGRGSPPPHKGSGTQRPTPTKAVDPAGSPYPVGSQGFEGVLVGGDVARGRVVCTCQSQ